MDPKIIIEQFFENTSYLVPGKQYHSSLPKELASWYCYTTDGGHSILAFIEGEFDQDNPEPLNDMCPCPVKAVLRNYRVHKGYPVAPLKYDETVGLITESDDDEF